MNRISKLLEDINQDIRDEMYSLRKDLYKKYPAMSNDERTIKAAKEISRKLSVNIKDILKLYTPSDNIQGSKSWDSEGNIK